MNPLPQDIPEPEPSDLQGLKQRFVLDPELAGTVDRALEAHASLAELDYVALLSDEGFRLADHGSRRYLKAERDSLGVLAVAAFLSGRRLSQGIEGLFDEMSIRCSPLQVFVSGLGEGCVLLNIARECVPPAILRLACRRTRSTLDNLLAEGLGTEAAPAGFPGGWMALDLNLSPETELEPFDASQLPAFFSPFSRSSAKDDEGKMSA
jgi:hypothetical protein